MSRMAGPETEPILEFEWTTGDDVCTELIRAMAVLHDVDFDEIQLLHEVVDPDALGELFAPTRNPQSRLNGSVRFIFNGHPVEISATGQGRIYSEEAAGG